MKKSSRSSPGSQSPRPETVLITGASSGIGLELARQFARNHHAIVLVAPVLSELTAIAERLRAEFGITVLPLAKDLLDSDIGPFLGAATAAEGLTIDILVNNAGLGQRGKSWEIPLEKEREMVRLNIEAVLALTKLFLPPMIERGHGRILNTASLAGFEPGPLLAVYHATKAFVLSWSEAIATELEDTGVTVTALCPGPVDTDFFPKADLMETKAFQSPTMMSPQDVAKTAYQALMDGERVIIPGSVNRARVFSRRLMPESKQAKQNLALYETVPRPARRRPRGTGPRRPKAK